MRVNCKYKTHTVFVCLSKNDNLYEKSTSFWTLTFDEDHHQNTVYVLTVYMKFDGAILLIQKPHPIEQRSAKNLVWCN